MTYSLNFDANALREWRKLGSTVREQFKRNWLRFFKIHT